VYKSIDIKINNWCVQGGHRAHVRPVGASVRARGGRARPRCRTGARARARSCARRALLRLRLGLNLYRYATETRAADDDHAAPTGTSFDALTSA
jgi:hypothetical protein